MPDCLFCQYTVEQCGIHKLLEDSNVLIFEDDRPHPADAPMHLIAIPKRHIQSSAPFSLEDQAVIGEIFESVNRLVKDLDLTEDGVTVRGLIGKKRGFHQNHLHFHVECNIPLQKILHRAGKD